MRFFASRAVRRVALMSAAIAYPPLPFAMAEPGEPPPPPRPAAQTTAPSRPAAPPPRPSLPVSSLLARETVSAALRAANYPEATSRIEGFRSRARLGALLPELWVRVARSTDESLRFAPTVDDPRNYSEAGAAGLLFEARVAWHFQRLVFDSDELSIEKMRVERAEGAAKLTSKVLAVLFAWQKARVRASGADAPDATDEQRTLAALEEAEAVVELDVLTGGWFSGRIGAAAKKP